MENTAKLVAEIDALFAKSSPGSWERDRVRHYFRDHHDHRMLYSMHAAAGQIFDSYGNEIAELEAEPRDETLDDVVARANFDLIAKLHNEWPVIRAILVNDAAPPIHEAIANDAMALAQQIHDGAISGVSAIASAIQAGYLRQEQRVTETLAAAVSKFAPDLAEQLRARFRDANNAVDDFVQFLRKQFR